MRMNKGVEDYKLHAVYNEPANILAAPSHFMPLNRCHHHHNLRTNLKLGVSWQILTPSMFCH